MTTTGHCIKLLRAVQQASADPDAAYLVRTRLKRALMALERGRKGSDTPGGPELSPAVGALVVSLQQRVHHLCQPSESLDVRWKSEWASVQADLMTLESQLADPLGTTV
jgi:hypothetical protein